MSAQPASGGLRWVHAAVVVALMAAAGIAAEAAKPRHRLSELNRDVNLEQQLPKAFAGWRIDDRMNGGVVNPQQEALLKSLYSQNVSRTYIDQQGRMVMLSIAYGGAQDGSLELHRPEVCYVAQGFKLEAAGRSQLQLDQHNVPLQRLYSQQGPRHEPISYWMRVGDDLMVSGLSQQLSRVRHGVRGWIPDGVLFRVSSISADRQAAYALQDRFVQDLLAASSPQVRRFLIGPVSQSGTPE